MKINPRDIRILATFELKQLFRSAPGVLALCFLFLPLFWLMSKMSGNAEMINNLAAGNLTQQETFLMEVVKWLVDIDDDFLARLFTLHSPFVTMLFVITAFGMPFMTMIAALDQNATDIGAKGIRFLLPRTSRDNLLLGRFVGTAWFWGIGIVGAGLAVTILALAIDTNHSLVGILVDGIWFSVGLFLISLPFAAFMAVCSTTSGNPLLSVTMGLGIYLAVVLMGGLGGWFHEGLQVIEYVFPSPLRYKLMLGTPTELIIAVIAMLAYTAVFLFGAGWIMRKRDL